MNKAALITEIEARYDGEVIVQGDADVQPGTNNNAYNWQVKVVNGLSANIINIPVIVFDEGGSEEAYYRDGIPVYPRANPEGTVNDASSIWRDAVAAELATRKTNGTGDLKTAVIDWVDEENKIAKVTGYFTGTGGVEEKEALVYEDNTSTLAFAPIVVA